MRRRETAQMLVKYQMLCIWEGECLPTVEVQRVAAWIFPTGSLPKNPEPAMYSPSEIEILRRMSERKAEGVTDPEV